MRKFILTASIASLAVPLAPAAEAQSNWSRQGRASAGYTVQQTRMRAGPDSDYPAIRIIPGGRQVDIFGCLRDWSWCDVGYRSDRGWVAGRLLSANYQGRRRTIVTIAPRLGILALTFSFGDYWDNHYRNRPFYSERNRWERRAYDNYRPQWGPRPSVAPQVAPVPAPRQTTPQRMPSGQRGIEGGGYRTPDTRNDTSHDEKMGH